LKKEKIGLIGLGAMGRGVAVNLLAKNFEVIGFDIIRVVHSLEN
jgi:3-hydroxyisobutyrate dehydrogenase-like beta-hydroxyacid dehydrogenase